MLRTEALVVRRLPVIQSSAPEDDQAASRPPAHWVAIGAGLAFTIWIPVAMLAMWGGRALAARWVDVTDPEALQAFQATASSGARAAVVVCLMAPALLSFLAAGVASGALVGRFGGRAGLREAAAGVALAGVVAAGVAALGGAASWPVLLATGAVLVLTGAAAGAIGARIGRGRRPAV